MTVKFVLRSNIITKMFIYINFYNLICCRINFTVFVSFLMRELSGTEFSHCHATDFDKKKYF